MFQKGDLVIHPKYKEGKVINVDLQDENIGVLFSEEVSGGPLDDSKYQIVKSHTLTKVEVTKSFFKIGDKVVHDWYGAGEIVSIDDRHEMATIWLNNEVELPIDDEYIIDSEMKRDVTVFVKELKMVSLRLI